MLKEIIDATHESLVEDIFNGSGQSDDSVSNPDDISVDDLHELKEIINPKSGKVLGYLIDGGADSEAGDIKVYTTFKLDSDGSIIDYSSESYGYHE